MIATDGSWETIVTTRLPCNERLGMFGNFGSCGAAVILLR